MTIGPGAVIQPASRPRRRGHRRWRPVVVALGVGAAVGLAWRLLAPVASTIVVDGAVYLRGHQELEAAQDGWLAILLAVAGALLAAVHALRRQARSATGLLSVVVALAVAGALAWQLGQWLGPASFTDQLAAGVRRPVTPLRLHSLAVLLVAPLLYALTRLLAAVFGTDD